MRFLRRNKKAKKHVLVISDLHLGAGAFIDGKKNPLEDFHSDSELVDFFHYFCSEDYASLEVEIIINGDFLDLLAVPYVKYFDDEFWSEEACLEKLELIIKAHPEVFSAMNKFLSAKNKKIVYIIGNHDAELVFDSLQEKLKETFNEENREKFIISRDLSTYEPVKGVFIQHGHEYEAAHVYDPQDSIIKTAKGKQYFLPSWGSYFVTHINNKYKPERSHCNEVKPIRSFFIHGLIFDTYFIVRFFIGISYYYFMVRFLHYYRQKMKWKDIMEDVLKELTLFEDYEKLTRGFFKKNKDAKVLIVGHTHKPTYREFNDRTLFINTGTWVRTVSLDLGRKFSETPRTFCHIQVLDENSDDFHNNVFIELNKWAPVRKLPYIDYA